MEEDEPATWARCECENEDGSEGGQEDGSEDEASEGDEGGGLGAGVCGTTRWGGVWDKFNKVPAGKATRRDDGDSPRGLWG